MAPGVAARKVGIGDVGNVKGAQALATILGGLKKTRGEGQKSILLGKNEKQIMPNTEALETDHLPNMSDRDDCLRAAILGFMTAVAKTNNGVEMLDTILSGVFDTPVVYLPDLITRFSHWGLPSRARWMPWSSDEWAMREISNSDGFALLLKVRYLQEMSHRLSRPDGYDARLYFETNSEERHVYTDEHSVSWRIANELPFWVKPEPAFEILKQEHRRRIGGFSQEQKVSIVGLSAGYDGDWILHGITPSTISDIQEIKEIIALPAENAFKASIVISPLSKAGPDQAPQRFETTFASAIRLTSQDLPTLRRDTVTR
ncbi:MAG: hypothetical protein PHH14_00780 [Candidatus Margulisbacteria bacterium]|nr:hypothetical protein [Candidatus Margulisiibacteriota bacterium]